MPKKKDTSAALAAKDAELTRAKTTIRNLRAEKGKLAEIAGELTGVEEGAEIDDHRKAAGQGRMGAWFAREIGAAAGGAAYAAGPGGKIAGLLGGLVGSGLELLGLGGEAKGFGRRMVNTGSGAAHGITGAAAADGVRKIRARKAPKEDDTEY